VAMASAADTCTAGILCLRPVSTIRFHPGTEELIPRLISVTVMDLAIKRHAADAISALRVAFNVLSGTCFKCLKTCWVNFW